MALFLNKRKFVLGMSAGEEKKKPDIISLHAGD